MKLRRLGAPVDVTNLPLEELQVRQSKNRTPVRIEARTDRKPVKTERVVVRKPPERKAQVAQERAEKPRAAARTKLTRRHSNPLDAQARDTRIQTWPCTSGGICDWQR